MLKMVLLLVSSLFSFGVKSDAFDSGNYFLVSEEEQTMNIVCEVNDYYIVKEGTYYLIYNNKRIDLGNISQVEMFFYNDKLYLIINENGELFIYEYDRLLEGRNYYEIIRRGAISFSSHFIDDVIYITGCSGEENEATYSNKSLNGNDAFLATFSPKTKMTSINYYGGATNECFLDVVVSNDIYLAGMKDGFGEGDFGNGGTCNSIFLTKLTFDYKIAKYVILDKTNNYLGLYSCNNKVYLVLKDSYYVFDSNLKLLKYKEFDGEALASSYASGVIMVLFRENYLIIDLNKGLEKKLVHDYLFNEVIKFNEFLLGKTQSGYYRLDLIVLGDDLVNYNYQKNSKVETLFGEVTLFKEEVSPHLDYQVFGTYNFKLYFETVGGINFEIDTKFNVPFEANVISGGVYPVGYRLSFTGKGYLDGNQIITNYQLLDSGKHTLVLKGVDSEKTIEFNVTSSQITFSEQLKRYSDISLVLGDNLNLKLNVKLPSDYIISGAVIGDKLYEANYDKDKNLLFIPYGKMNEVGQFEITVDRIIYHDKDSEYYLPLKEVFLVNVLKPHLELKVSGFNEAQMLIDCIDMYQCARFFELVVRDDNKKTEEVYKYPLSNSNIYLTNLDSASTYTISYYLVNDYGGEYLESTLITTLKAFGKNELNIGEIKVLSYEGTLNRFMIEFDEDFMTTDLKEVVINDEVIYINQKDSILKYILFLLLAFILGLIIPVGIKMVLKRVK